MTTATSRVNRSPGDDLTHHQTRFEPQQWLGLNSGVKSLSTGSNTSLVIETLSEVDRLKRKLMQLPVWA